MSKINRKLKLMVSDTNVSMAQREYIKKYLNMLRVVRIYQIAIIVILIGSWELATRIGIMDDFVFSSPSRIIQTFIDMAKDGTIFYHLAITLMETILSFFLVIIIGIGMAVLLWWNERVSRVLEPYLVVLNSLPKSALAPVFIVWLGNNMKTIIVAAVTVALIIKVQWLS